MTARQRWRWFGAVLLAAVAMLESRADDTALVLLVQPLPKDERTGASYQPLAQYIQALTGRRCVIQEPPNFPAYWNVLRRNNYDIAFDGPHFADYRSNKFGFTALAKVPDTASYSLIVRDSERLRDPTQLVGRRIASLGMLSSGAPRLNGMFPNSIRQPVLVDVQTAENGIDLLLDRRVEAAFLPTPVVSQRLARGGIVVILTTEPSTRLVLSASPRLDEQLREKIREGVLQATESDAGRSMLQRVGIERFEAALPESFANQRNVLKSYWGY